MKKTYMTPAQETIELKMNCQMLAGSGGVADGDGLGNDFNDKDETFAPPFTPDFFTFAK